ncbi:hypothetical protein [Sphingobacterium kyonggiense]
MSYEQTYHIGNNQNTRTEQAKGFAPTIRRVRQLATKTKGHKPGAERQAEIRTNSNATNGILKCTFLPKLKTAHSVLACQKTERDFYNSLSKLAEHYSIEPMTTQPYNFPYNIVLGMWDIDTKLKRTHRNWDSLHLLQDSRKTILQSEERFEVGTTLFHIPIIPLFQMLKDPKRKKNAQLLLSVCSYLYHIARIPYYRQEDSYLYWLYETHKDWIDYDDTDETETYKSELRRAECIGDIIEQKLYSPINLTLFEQRLSSFKSLDTFDKECWQVACKTLALYREYPNTTVFRNAPISEQDPYDDDIEIEAITMEKYISFVADTKGVLYNSVVESINNELNEYGRMEEPSISIPFDGKNTLGKNLDFENRMFDLLDDLFIVLNNFNKTKK